VGSRVPRPCGGGVRIVEGSAAEEQSRCGAGRSVCPRERGLVCSIRITTLTFENGS
jgi:hypothetical protein